MGPKILIVEDDRFLVNAYRKKFGMAGFQVSVAIDGDTALTQLRADKPDIILLDLVMPKKDGFLFLAELRKFEGGQEIPVVVASNLGQKEHVNRVKEYGVTEYIVKTSMALDELVKRVAALVPKK